MKHNYSLNIKYTKLAARVCIGQNFLQSMQFKLLKLYTIYGYDGYIVKYNDRFYTLEITRHFLSGEEYYILGSDITNKLM